VAASPRSLRLTDAYRARLVELRRRAVTATAAAWALELDDLDASFLAWLGTADRILSTTQAELVRLSDLYVAHYIASELGVPPSPVGVAPSTIAGTTNDGRALREILRPSLFTVKKAIGEGRPFAEASKLGEARALRNATTEVDGAADRTVDELLEARPEVRGWRRVASGGACGACLAAMTGAVQDTSKLLHRHPHCRCTKEPVVDGVPDRAGRPTGKDLFDQMSAEEQNALFAGRGGERKAELLRSGAVDLEDFELETRFAVEGTKGRGADRVLTERSLKDLEEIAARRSGRGSEPAKKKPRRRKDNFDAERWKTERDWSDWSDSPVGRIIGGID